jgi:hypothetical protein
MAGCPRCAVPVVGDGGGDLEAIPYPNHDGAGGQRAEVDADDVPVRAAVGDHICSVRLRSVHRWVWTDHSVGAATETSTIVVIRVAIRNRILSPPLFPVCVARITMKTIVSANNRAVNSYVFRRQGLRLRDDLRSEICFDGIFAAVVAIHRDGSRSGQRIRRAQRPNRDHVVIMH